MTTFVNPYKVMAGWLLDPLSGNLPSGRGYQLRLYYHNCYAKQDYLTKAEMDAEIAGYEAQGYVKQTLGNGRIALQPKE